MPLRKRAGAPGAAGAAGVTAPSPAGGTDRDTQPLDAAAPAPGAMRPLRIVVADDEPLALGDTIDCVADVDPTARVAGFETGEEALAWVRKSPCDLALLDIEMPGMGGLELARALAEEFPATRVVFITSYDDYALEAYGIRAQGYLLKPVDLDALAREMDEARRWAGIADRLQIAEFGQDGATGEADVSEEAQTQPERPLQVTTFGGFEAYVRGERLVFKRSRSKELLALLIDRRGAGIGMREAIATFWPDEPYGNAKRSYYQSMVASLRSVLRDAGVEEVLVKGWNSLAVDPELIDCDLYRFVAGDPVARAAYHHDYLPSYEWAEYTIPELERRLREG